VIQTRPKQQWSSTHRWLTPVDGDSVVEIENS